MRALGCTRLGDSRGIDPWAEWTHGRRDAESLFLLAWAEPGHTARRVWPGLGQQGLHWRAIVSASKPQGIPLGRPFRFKVLLAAKAPASCLSLGRKYRTGTEVARLPKIGTWAQVGQKLDRSWTEFLSQLLPLFAAALRSSLPLFAARPL